MTDVPFDELTVEEQLELRSYRGECLPTDDRLPLVVDKEFDVSRYLEQFAQASSTRDCRNVQFAEDESDASTNTDVEPLQDVPIDYPDGASWAGEGYSRSPDECSLINIRLVNEHIRAVLDPTVQSTWISHKLYSQNAVAPLMPDCGCIADVNDNLRVIGRGKIRVALWGRRFDIVVRVARYVPNGMLLGSEFMDRNKLNIDEVKSKGWFDIPCFGVYTRFNGKLFSAKALSVSQKETLRQLREEDACHSSTSYEKIFQTSSCRENCDGSEEYLSDFTEIEVKKDNRNSSMKRPDNEELNRRHSGGPNTRLGYLDIVQDVPVLRLKMT